jgi:hypothetical protein
MNEKVLTSLIHILQKHANAIRKLQVANIALMELARREAENSGMPSEEFEKRFLAILSSTEKARPVGPGQDIAKEIEETIDELNALEALARKLLN